jgi:hypothetical protein
MNRKVKHREENFQKRVQFEVSKSSTHFLGVRLGKAREWNMVYL